MSEFICTNPVVPLRTAPSHRSEMGSQILLGETYTIVDMAGSWTKIELSFDNYSGWVDNDHFTFIKNHNKQDGEIIHKDILAEVPDKSSIKIFAGSEISNNSPGEGRFDSGGVFFKTKVGIQTKTNNENPVITAKQFINAPYLWGGRTSGGIDCSGLSQIVYKLHGISVPRDSFNQAEIGQTVNLLAEAVPGDLLFFDNSSGKITHVAIMNYNNTVIHASGSVRIDKIDHQGIFSEDLKRYTHKLRVIKRLID